MSEIQSEQTFGRESVEKSLGYMPAVVDMPKDGPMDSNFEPSSDRLTEGAKEEDVHDQNNLSNPVATSIVRQEVARISSLIEKGPRSWPKKERVAFWFLPGKLREAIVERDRHASKILRNAQNEAAQLRHKLKSLQEKNCNAETTKEVR